MMRGEKVMQRSNHFRFAFILLLFVLSGITSSICLLLYQYDNKYTAPGPASAYGSMEVEAETLNGQGVIWLVDGWEFYGGLLLTPADFRSNMPAPDRYIFTGQQGGFESVTGNPHGSASYRLTIKLPEQTQTYSLYLPELRSSCRLYVNGVERLALGEISPEHYKAGTAEKIVPFEAAGEVELLLAVSDFSGAYGGLTYPPALGTPDSIHDMTTVRLNLRTALLTMTALFGVISLLIGIANPQNSLPGLYALYCLTFFGFTCYPVAKTLFPAFGGLYFVENLSFCAMILMIFILQRKLFTLETPVNTFGVAFGGLICVVCIFYHLFLPQASLTMLLSYSRLISLYKSISAALLTGSTIWMLLRRSDETAHHTKILLCGIVIFDCTLMMDRFLPLYEPIYSGWFLEISSLCMVLLIGAILLQEIYIRTAASLRLEETIRLTGQNLAMQKEQHQTMIEAIAGERTFRHDLRQHISVLHEFAERDDLDSLKQYFDQLEGRLPANYAGVFCENAAVDAILRHYKTNAESAGIEFSAAVQVAEGMPISDVDLCVIFGNCLENALEACKRQTDHKKYVMVSAGTSVGVLAITVENSFNGSLRRSGAGFFSSKQSRIGIGTASVQAIAKKYNGKATFKSDDNKFQALIVLHL